MHILLTGAAGFVGSHLLSRMKRDGVWVRALDRHDTRVMKLADERVIEPLSPDCDFEAYLAGVDTVIHLADGFNAYEHLPVVATNREASKRVQTTVALANVAARMGVRFIYLSTVKAMCGAYADHILSETTPEKPQSLYGKLKLEAERAILSVAQKHGTRAIILRFPIVFGSGVGGNMEKLYKLIDTPYPLPFRGLDNRRSLISLDSLINAVLAITRQNFEGGQQAEQDIFLVHDGALSTKALVRLLRVEVGRPERLFPLPKAVWSVAERLPGIGRLSYRFTRSLELCDQKFRSTYDWRPASPLEQSLQACFGSESLKRE